MATQPAIIGGRRRRLLQAGPQNSRFMGVRGANGPANIQFDAQGNPISPKSAQGTDANGNPVQFYQQQSASTALPPDAGTGTNPYDPFSGIPSAGPSTAQIIADKGGSGSPGLNGGGTQIFPPPNPALIPQTRITSTTPTTESGSSTGLRNTSGTSSGTETTSGSGSTALRDQTSGLTSKTLSPGLKATLENTIGSAESGYANAGYTPEEQSKINLSPEEQAGLISASTRPIAGAADRAQRMLLDRAAASGNYAPGLNATAERIQQEQGRQSAEARQSAQLGILASQRAGAEATGNARIGQQNSTLGLLGNIVTNAPETSVEATGTRNAAETTDTSGLRNTSGTTTGIDTSTGGSSTVTAPGTQTVVSGPSTAGGQILPLVGGSVGGQGGVAGPSVGGSPKGGVIPPTVTPATPAPVTAPAPAVPPPVGGGGGGVVGKKGRAKGGPVGPGEYIVGEKGPEVLEMQPGSQGHVFPHSTYDAMMRRGMPGRAEGGFVGNPIVPPTLPPAPDVASQDGAPVLPPYQSPQPILGPVQSDLLAPGSQAPGYQSKGIATLARDAEATSQNEKDRQDRENADADAEAARQNASAGPETITRATRNSVLDSKYRLAAELARIKSEADDRADQRRTEDLARSREDKQLQEPTSVDLRGLVAPIMGKDPNDPALYAFKSVDPKEAPGLVKELTAFQNEVTKGKSAENVAKIGASAKDQETTFSPEMASELGNPKLAGQKMPVSFANEFLKLKGTLAENDSKEADKAKAEADKQETLGLKWVQGTDPNTGKPIVAPLSQAKKLGLDDVAALDDSGQQAVRTARFARNLATKEGSTPETMGVLQLADSLAKDGKMGVAMSRFNNLMAKGIGASPGDDPRIIALMNKAETLTVAHMKTFIGMAGGRSPVIMQRFMDMANAGKMDATTFRGGVQALSDIAKDVAMDPKDLPNSGVRGGTPTHTAMGSDGKRHYTDASGKVDLGVVQ